MYAPVNHCIYCGIKDVLLSKEHIIPYSLGGTLVLPKASCAEHAALTSNLERVVARDTYGIHRAYESAPSRRKGRHKSTLRTKTTVEGLDMRGQKVTAQIPVADQPRLPMIVNLPVPGVLSGTPQGVTLQCQPMENDRTIVRLRERLGWSRISIASPLVQPVSFVRVLAKIAHSYACAEMNGRPFTPTLLPLILGESEGEIDSVTYYVGGFDPKLPQDSRSLLLREVSIAGRTLLVVEISLQFFSQLPRYQVVCGTLP